MALDAIPGKEWQGNVDYVYPILTAPLARPFEVATACVMKQICRHNNETDRDEFVLLSQDRR
ncbi:hypothetical protein O9992_30200 [Vibrio lentus]|nr:hypothetical protein [Vibrio lentus]